MSSGDNSDSEIAASILDRWNPKWGDDKPRIKTNEKVIISTAGDDGDQGISSLVSRWKTRAETKPEKEPDRSSLQVVRRKKIELGEGEDDVEKAEIKTILQRTRYDKEEVKRELEEAQEQMKIDAEKRKIEREEDDKRREALKTKREAEENKRKEEVEETTRLLKEKEAKRKEEDKKRKEEAEKRRKALNQQSDMNGELMSKRNFVIVKKTSNESDINDEMNDMNNVLMANDDAKKSKEQLDAEKQAILNQRIPPLDIEGFSHEELLEMAEDLWQNLVSTASETYDLNELSKRKEYDIKELKERANAQKKPLNAGLDIPLMPKTDRSISSLAGKFSSAPPKVDVMNPFSRVTDNRTFADRMKMFQK